MPLPAAISGANPRQTVEEARITGHRSGSRDDVPLVGLDGPDVIRMIEHQEATGLLQTSDDVLAFLRERARPDEQHALTRRWRVQSLGSSPALMRLNVAMACSALGSPA